MCVKKIDQFSLKSSGFMLQSVGMTPLPTEKPKTGAGAALTVLQWRRIAYLFGARVMQDNTLVIVALVGLAVICLGLFVVLFVTVFRFTGRNFMSFLALLVRDS